MKIEWGYYQSFYLESNRVQRRTKKFKEDVGASQAELLYETTLHYIKYMCIYLI